MSIYIYIDMVIYLFCSFMSINHKCYLGNFVKPNGSLFCFRFIRNLCNFFSKEKGIICMDYFLFIIIKNCL